MTHPCPKCGAPCERVEVDIGVGVECGPWHCTDASCCWSEDDGIEAFKPDAARRLLALEAGGLDDEAPEVANELMEWLKGSR